ncbi:MAG: response regulator [Nitrospira sp.]|nr:response regulator [Nitrospira sp.]
MSVVTHIRLLHVASDPSDHHAVRSALTDRQIQWDLLVCQAAGQVLDRLIGNPPDIDLILCDNVGLQKSGIAVFQEIRQSRVMIPFVILLGVGTEDLAVEALKAGVDDYIMKDPAGAYLTLLPVVLREAVQVYQDRLAWKASERAMQKSFDELEIRVRGQAEEVSRVKQVLQEEMKVRQGVEESLLQCERQLRQAQKMEAIGTLAGGIAHDFNNILSSILGYAELALMNAAQTSLIHTYLNEVITAATRARELVRQILAFSRTTEQERQSVDLPQIVSEALRLLRPVLPANIDIRQSGISGNKGCLIHADPTQIHQVLMNLCTNAEAALRKQGGVLEIAVTTEDIKEPVMHGGTQLAPGHYIRLTVSDSGEGMDPKILDRIFDPFFTTKSLGEGTGIGLAVVHSIVLGHGGAVAAASAPGLGSRFDVLLPCLYMSKPLAFDDEGSLPTGKGMVLFVDDEESIARWGEQLLTYLGYDVVFETCAQKALELFRRQPFQYDIVVTDQTMPVMTGEMFAREILAIRKDIPIVLCTGYSHAMSLEKSKAMGIRAFLMKPVKAQQLAMTLKEIIATEDNRNVSDPVL